MSAHLHYILPRPGALDMEAHRSNDYFFVKINQKRDAFTISVYDTPEDRNALADQLEEIVQTLRK